MRDSSDILVKEMKRNLFSYVIRFVCVFAFLGFNVSTLLAHVGEKIFEFRAREGLPNVCDKIRKTDTIRIAYFGGSITAQQGWRVQSFDYLQKRFPSAVFSQIDASMGGTGSLLGVLRLDNDVLRYQPDLVFVEFAVNDSNTPDTTVEQTMEGIVRKIWRKNPYCDICFVYTIKEDLLKMMDGGKLHSTVCAMERVAEAYQIPSVYLPYDVLMLLSQNKLVMRTPKGVMLRVSGDELNNRFVPKQEEDGKIYFSPDGVHPYLNTGHVLYTQVLKRALDNIMSEPGKQYSHSLAPLLSSDNYEYAKRISFDSMDLRGKWVKADENSDLYKSFKRHFDELWIGEIGATVKFRFYGKGLVCYDIMSPEGCRLEVIVDGQKFFIDRFDGYCTYSRYHFAELVKGLDPDKEHTVTIKVTDEHLDKTSILFERNRNDLKEHPEKYKPVHWLLNALYIIP